MFFLFCFFFNTSVCVDTCTKGKHAVDWLVTASGSNYHLKKRKHNYKTEGASLQQIFPLRMKWQIKWSLASVSHLTNANAEAALKGRDSLHLGVIHDLRKQQWHENF